MLGILIIFLLSAVSLSVLFWLGSIFVQSYIYTQPSENLHWQGPAAGVALALYLTLWCTAIIYSPGASPTNLPYDTLFRFNAKTDMTAEPVKYMRVQRYNNVWTTYRRERIDQYRYTYVEDNAKKTAWDRGAKAIEIEHNGEVYAFKPVEADATTYRTFVSEDGRWTIPVYAEGPSGIPVTFQTGRFIINITLNVMHFVLWFVCFCFILRYLPSHALLLSVVFWLLATLILVPMLLSYAGEQAALRHVG